MIIYTHENSLKHEVASGHPERPERIQHLLRHLQEVGISQDYRLATAPSASIEDIIRAHPQQHIDFLTNSQPSEGVVPLDPDTWMGVHSHAAALTAAGAVCQGVDDVLNISTGVKRIFCAVRPPGHHAEADAAMGFCLYNSVAVAALRALSAGLTRVAILDFDVHHGNGTVDIFKADPRVLVCSSYQHPFYPNRMTDITSNNIVNTPLQAGDGSTAFRQAVENHWLPAIEQHQPELIFVSAGFDAHIRDPLANINLDEDDFTWVTGLIVNCANQYSSGRIVSTLEGGYDLEALASSTVAHLEALAL